MSWLAITLGLTAIGLINVACSPSNQTSPLSTQPDNAIVASSDANATLETFNVAVIPWQDSNEQAANIEAFGQYLQEVLGVTVNIELTESYDDAVDQLVAGDAQMAALGAFTYIKAHARNADLEPLVAPITQATGRPWYTSVMVVHANSGINTIDDLRDKRFSFVSNSSTSGFLIPFYNFKQLEIVPEDYFDSLQFSGSHNQSIELLVAEEVDAIVTENLNFDRENKPGGALANGDYKVIWESDPIPNGPIVISSTLPDAFKLNLQKALINAPEGLADVSGSESAGYTTTEDADYDSIRKLHQALDL